MKRLHGMCAALGVLAAMLAAGVPAWAEPAFSTQGYDLTDPVFTGLEWQNQETVVKINREDPRTIFVPFNTKEGAKANPAYSRMGNSENFIDLNGTWDFRLDMLTNDMPAFYEAGYVKEGDWKTIPVPSSWQVAFQYAGVYGDWPIYQNQQYPWTAYGMPMGAPRAPDGLTYARRNPVGYYMREVDVPASWAGRQSFISFMGASQGLYVWVNGHPVGYGEDSLTASEFDITPYIVPGQANKIAARVHRWTTGGFLENQDQIDVSGLIRDVFLFSAPKTGVRDFRVITDLTAFDEGADADLIVKFQLTNRYGAAASGYSLSTSLFGPDGTPVFENERLEFSMAAGQEALELELTKRVSNPLKWSAEYPNLYTAVFTLCDGAGAETESVGERVGFREFMRSGGGSEVWNETGTAADPNRLRINGKALYLKGVNRGEVDALGGKTITRERALLEIKTMKRNNVNSVRTSHYPHDPYMYELYDEYGIYVMDEFNIESHSGASLGTDSTTGGVWSVSMLDRAQNTVLRDKNHPSVFCWSLGNEAGAGANHNANGAWVRAYDSTRFLHFMANSAISDMSTDMYVAATNYLSYSNNNKPYAPCEFEHAMGNAGGGFFAYIQGFENNPRAQGAWIWDWYDQGIMTKTADGGKLFAGYGGDWGETSSSNAFCANGMGFLAIGEPAPSMDEIRAGYQDIKMTAASDDALLAGDITFKNHALFRNSAEYDFEWEVLENSSRVASGTMEVDLPAWNANELTAPARVANVPYALPAELKPGAEYFLNLSFRLKDATAWADKGFATSFAQFELPVGVPADGISLADAAPFTDVSEDGGEIRISGVTGVAGAAGAAGGKPFSVAISKATGLISSYSVDGKLLIKNGPVPNFYRALTDNDIGGTYTSTSFGVSIGNAWRYAGRDKTVSDFKVMRINGKSLKITVSGNLASKGIDRSASLPSPYSIEYSVYGNGDVAVTNKVQPNREAYSLGMVGSYVQLPLDYRNVEYFGRGPNENYIDRRTGEPVGQYRTTTDGMFVTRSRSQENGNRTDVRWAAVTDGSGFGLLAVSDGVMEFSALNHTAEDMSTWSYAGQQTGPRHPADLNEPTEVTLSLNSVQMGVGSENWQRGPYGQTGTLNYGDYMVRSDRDYEYSYTLRPIFPGQDPMALSDSLIAVTPMLANIFADGAPLADFSDRVSSYDYALTASQPFPIITAECAEGVSMEISQASAAQKYAVIRLVREGEEGAYVVNFVRDLDFVSDISLDGARIADFNKIIRDYAVQWPYGAAAPEISAAAVDGVTLEFVQPAGEPPKGAIIATNAYGDEQVYAITLIQAADYDDQRPAAWGRKVDVQAMPLGSVRYNSYSAPINANNYYYVNNPPSSGSARGDLPFVGLYPNRRITLVGNRTADAVQIDPDTGKKVFVHKNSNNVDGYATGDTFVGLEARNTENIAGKTLVMHAKVRPAAGSFGLYFRDGNNECRNSAEIFKVSFSNTGIRYSTTTTANGSANGSVSDSAMTAWQTTLDRSLYYEVWMTDTPIPSGDDMGHNVSALVRFTDAGGREVSYSVSRRQTTAAASTVNFPVFALYEGNLTATANIEEFSVYTLNPDSPLITYGVSGADRLAKPPIGGEPASLQLAATAVHSAADMLPVPFAVPNVKWEILGQDSLQGVSIDQNGLVSLAGDFVDSYFDVMASNADGGSPWAPAIKRVSVVSLGEITGVAADKPAVPYGASADIKVSVDGEFAEGERITVELFGKTAPAVNGVAAFSFAADEIPLPNTYDATATSESGFSNAAKVAVLGMALAADSETGAVTAYFNAADGASLRCILAEYDQAGKTAFVAARAPELKDGYWHAEISRDAAAGNSVKAFAWDAGFAPVF